MEFTKSSTGKHSYLQKYIVFRGTNKSPVHKHIGASIELILFSRDNVLSTGGFNHIFYLYKSSIVDIPI